MFVLTLFDCSTFLSLLTIFSLIILSLPSVHQLHLPGCGGQNSLCILANEDLGTLAEYDPLSGYEPNDYHITELLNPISSNPRSKMGSRMTSSAMTPPPLFTQEREDDACRRRASHSQDEGLSSSLSSSVSHDRTGRPVVKPFEQVSSVREIPSHSSESEQIRILLERQREQMTPRTRRCSITLSEYTSITPSEKACLSVSRRRPCPSERGDPLRRELGDLLWQVVRS